MHRRPPEDGRRQNVPMNAMDQKLVETARRLDLQIDQVPRNIAIIMAKARTVAEPVSIVSHHTRANWTSALPTREHASPPQMTKNLRINRFSSAWPTISVMSSSAEER